MGTTVGRRYDLLGPLGSGGMGLVSRSIDRLTGRAVALKQVRVWPLQEPDGADVDLRLCLTREFQTLASVRHPNVIRVLDHGFDDDGQPYFTMDLLEPSRTILEAARELPLEGRVDLILQMLGALSYLHRRRIVHGDLKPGNVLVAGGTVKVLDFGISMCRDLPGGTESRLGTVDYIAPELLLGSHPDESSDLYAAGVIACELLAGRRPFQSGSLGILFSQILGSPADTARLGADARLAPVIDRLLAKAPEARHASAEQASAALAGALGRLLPREPREARDSFITAARFVGRRDELSRLSEALDRAMRGLGETWLVGGESGAGKSRLLGEIAVLALVKDAVVLQGQASGDRGAPYEMWREPLRRLCLRISLSPLEASVLRDLVPDIERLLGRPVMPAPEIDTEHAMSRLVAVIEAVFRRLDRPVVLLLEDLHHASDESLSVLHRLHRIASQLPLMILGTYRDDEALEIPLARPGMTVLKLPRLAAHEVSELSESMLGAAGKQPEVVDYLLRQTDGNVFFLVELVRALADSVGGLEDIGKVDLSSAAFPGGIHWILEHRLSRIPEGLRPLLRAAAALGRALDTAVLAELAPGLDIEGSLGGCADVGVLEVHHGQWRFTHDKLCDALVSGLTADERSSMHRRVAEAIERVYPDDRERAATLAHHFRMAGDDAREADYQAIAGERALEVGACQVAVERLERALRLGAGRSAPVKKAILERLLGEAYFGAGDLPASRDSLESAGARLSWLLPHDAPWVLARLLGRAVLPELTANLAARCGAPADRLLGIARRLRSAPRRAGAGHGSGAEIHPAGSEQKSASARVEVCADTQIIAREAAAAYERLAHIYFFENEVRPVLSASMRALVAAFRAGPSPALGRAYADVSLSCGLLPNHSLARAFEALAGRTARESGDLGAIAWACELEGIYRAGLGDWGLARASLEHAMVQWQELGDRTRWQECLTLLGVTLFHKGDGEEAAGLRARLREASAESSARATGWALLGEGESALRRGDLREAVAALDEASALAGSMQRIDRIWLGGLFARVMLHEGRRRLAEEAADAAMDLISRSRATGFYVLEGYSGVAEVYLSLARCSTGERPARREGLGRSASLAVRALGAFARVFPMAQPRALLWRGVFDAEVSGSPADAGRTFQEAVAKARELGMPYERGLAHRALGLHVAGDAKLRQKHLIAALDCFLRAGATPDARRVRAALQGNDDDGGDQWPQSEASSSPETISGDPQISREACIPDITAASTAPMLRPLSVQSPAR